MGSPLRLIEKQRWYKFSPIRVPTLHKNLFDEWYLTPSVQEMTLTCTDAGNDAAWKGAEERPSCAGREKKDLKRIVKETLPMPGLPDNADETYS